MGLRDFLKESWGLYKVGGRYGRAMQLEKENRLEHAYAKASDALTILWSLDSRSVPVVTNALVLTTFVDKIALRLEKPLMTKHAVLKALDLCRAAGFEDDDDSLKVYIEWLKYRREQQKEELK